MRIGLFSDTYLPDINGVVSSVELLRKKLTEAGHTVYVICTYPGLLKVKREGNIIRLPGLEFKKLYGYAVTSPVHLFLYDDIEALNLDIIHIQTEFGVGIFGQLCANRFHIPIVRTYHTTYEDYTHYVNFFNLETVDKTTKKLVARLSRYYGNSCMRMIAPSLKTKTMLEKYGVKTPISVIPTGIELERFAQANTSAATIAELRRQCQIKEGEKVFLYVGRIAEEKSIALLLESFKMVKEAHLPAHLVIVGGGPDFAKLTAYSGELGLNELVTFTDKVAFKEVAAYYHSADAFISASTTETQGMTYIEAMASSLVVFARYDECVYDLVTEGENGYYFNDATELFTKIQRFLSLDAHTYEAMAAVGLKKAQAYDADSFGQKIAQVYREVMESYHQYYLIKDVKLKNDYVNLALLDGSGKSVDLFVSLTDFAEYGLRKNERLSFSLYDRLKAEENLLLAYCACLRQIALKDRSVKQIENYLISRYSLNDREVKLIVDKLSAKELLNDYNYALAKAAGLNARLCSYQRVIADLKKDGIAPEIIAQTVIEEYDSELLKALKSANKYRLLIHGRSLKEKKELIGKKLITNGFSYEIVKDTLTKLDLSDDILEENNNLRKAAKKARARYAHKYQGTLLRNKLYQYLLVKGYNSDNIYAILNEMEWEDE